MVIGLKTGFDLVLHGPTLIEKSHVLEAIKSRNGLGFANCASTERSTWSKTSQGRPYGTNVGLFGGIKTVGTFSITKPRSPMT